MSLQKLTDRVYYLPWNQETDQPNLYYIHGRDYSVAVDAGQSRRHVELFYEAIVQAGFPLPRYTVITHWHWDHTFGLPYIQGESIANSLTVQQLKTVQTWAWTDEAMQERERTGEDIAFCNEHIRKEYPSLKDIAVSLPCRGIDTPETLDMGDVQLHLFPMDSPHSRDAVLIWLPAEKVLFVGDADCGDYYDNQGLADPDRLEVYLKFIRGLDFELCCIGHDAPESREENLRNMLQLETGKADHFGGRK